MRQTVTVRPTPEQAISWSGAAYRNGRRTLPAFLAWAADFVARYTLEEYVQEMHRKRDPILARLEEKKQLKRLMDAAWHALDFLPPPDRCPVYTSIRDPKGDLRKALEAVQEYLADVQDEWR